MGNISLHYKGDAEDLIIVGVAEKLNIFQKSK